MTVFLHKINDRFFKRLVILALLPITFSQTAYSSEPLDSLLKSLPQQKVTFDVVLNYALASNSFKAVVVTGALSEATTLRSRTTLDWHFLAKQQALRDLSKPQTILSPEEVISQTASVGFNKSFQTGTGISLEWVNKKVDTNFASGATGNPVFDSVLKDRSEYLPEMSLSIKQDLLKNSFGRAVRANLTQAQKQAEVQKWQAVEGLKSWYIGLLKTFYGAWLAQEQVRQADKDFQRQLRLFRVNEQRYRRGNTEQADFLQMKVALNLSEQRKIAAQQRLVDVWREVVVQLELPNEWLQIDPMLIPIELDEPSVTALGICEEGWKEDLSSEITVATLESEAVAAQTVAAKSRLLPDVSAFATVKRGSRNASSTEAQKEVSRGDFPTTSYGLQLDWNFNSSLERAQYVEANVAKLRADSTLLVKKGSAQTNWLSQCANLRRLKTFQNQLQVALKDQGQRLDLEEKRFKEGRSLLFQLIQAQGDLYSTQGVQIQNSVDLRLSAWDLLRQSNYLNQRIHQLMNSYLKERVSYE